MSKITIKELASMAGVSQTAVSFVLNNRPGVSEETRAKVLEIIDRVGYTASISSRALALQKSFNITILYQEASSPFDDLFYFDVSRGALDICNEKGYNIVLNKIKFRNDEPIIPDIISKRNTDGILIFQDVSKDVYDRIISYGAPAVVVDSYDSCDLYPSIGIDAAESTTAALEYLRSKGHKKIGLIATGFITEYRNLVFNTYKNYMKNNGLEFRREWISDGARDEKSAGKCAETIMACAERPTALLCTSDIYAIGAINNLTKCGFSVPYDVSVIGADNIIVSKYTNPSLTTVDFDKVYLGRRAFEMLEKLINGETCESSKMSISGVCERKSVKEI